MVKNSQALIHARKEENHITEGRQNKQPAFHVLDALCPRFMAVALGPAISVLTGADKGDRITHRDPHKGEMQRVRGESPATVQWMTDQERWLVSSWLWVMRVARPRLFTQFQFVGWGVPFLLSHSSSCVIGC